MVNARDDVKMSRDHKDVAATIAELGVPNVVECLTNDGYFSAGRPLISSS